MNIYRSTQFYRDLVCFGELCGFVASMDDTDEQKVMYREKAQAVADRLSEEHYNIGRTDEAEQRSLKYKLDLLDQLLTVTAFCEDCQEEKKCYRLPCHQILCAQCAAECGAREDYVDYEFGGGCSRYNACESLDPKDGKQ